MEKLQQAKRLNPFHRDHYFDAIGWAYFFLKRYDHALHEVQQIRVPSAGEHRNTAAIFARMGQNEQAKVHAEKALKLEPEFSVSTFSRTMLFKHKNDLEFYLEALRMAGLPD